MQIGVHEKDLLAELPEHDGQVDRGGGLPFARHAGRHDDRLDAAGAREEQRGPQITVPLRDARARVRLRKELDRLQRVLDRVLLPLAEKLPIAVSLRRAARRTGSRRATEGRAPARPARACEGCGRGARGGRRGRRRPRLPRAGPGSGSSARRVGKATPGGSARSTTRTFASPTPVRRAIASISAWRLSRLSSIDRFASTSIFRWLYSTALLFNVIASLFCAPRTVFRFSSRRSAVR